jgi:hypothetical protein
MTPAETVLAFHEAMELRDDSAFGHIAEDFIQYAAGPQGRAGFRQTLATLEHDLDPSDGNDPSAGRSGRSRRRAAYDARAACRFDNAAARRATSNGEVPSRGTSSTSGGWRMVCSSSIGRAAMILDFSGRSEAGRNRGDRGVHAAPGLTTPRAPARAASGSPRVRSCHLPGNGMADELAGRPSWRAGRALSMPHSARDARPCRTAPRAGRAPMPLGARA